MLPHLRVRNANKVCGSKKWMCVYWENALLRHRKNKSDRYDWTLRKERLNQEFNAMQCYDDDCFHLNRESDREKELLFFHALTQRFGFYFIALRGFFYSFSSFAYRLLLFHSNSMVLLVSHEFSMVHFVRYFDCGSWFIPLYNTL